MRVVPQLDFSVPPLSFGCQSASFPNDTFPFFFKTVIPGLDIPASIIAKPLLAFKILRGKDAAEGAVAGRGDARGGRRGRGKGGGELGEWTRSC